MESFKDWLYSFLSGAGLRIINALAVLFLGLVAMKIIINTAKVYLSKTRLERTTVTFIISILSLVLYLVLFYFVITIMTPTASAGLIAVLGSIALAVGLALKDSISDFANGIIIIVTKPFKEGDYVKFGEIEGYVKSIGAFTTTVITVDNKKQVLTNGRVMASQITNFSSRPTRRLDLEIPVSQHSDIDLVISVLNGIADSHEGTLKEPVPLIRFYAHSDNAFVFRFRVWVNNADYWNHYYALIEKIYKALKENGIELPAKPVSIINADIKEEDNNNA